MAFKFIALLAVLAVANASYLRSAPLAYASYPASSYAYAVSGEPLAYTAPIITKPIVEEPYNPNPQYNFNYGVSDVTTGDHKSQEETRNGDQVKGSYSFIESDGTKRTVDYTADDVNGFNAVVHKEPATIAVQSAPAPVIVKSVASPVYHATSVYHGAPVAHAYAPYVQTVQNW